MDDALAEAKTRFSKKFVPGQNLDIEPLIADQWVTTSLLQKSIRRGEGETAQRAAFTLFAQKGSAIRRRFMVMAFEDVGAASPDAVAMTVAASTDPSWRGKNGGDLHIAVQLARVLAQAPKSRSAEHLITSAQHHPSLAKARMLRGASSRTDQLAAVMKQNASLTERAIAASCASGVGWNGEKREHSDLAAVLETFHGLGVPDELVAATGIAARKTREPITLMVPLVWLAATMRPIWPRSTRMPLPWRPNSFGRARMSWRRWGPRQTSSCQVYRRRALRHSWRLSAITLSTSTRFAPRCSSSSDPHGRGRIPFWRRVGANVRLPNLR